MVDSKGKRKAHTLELISDDENNYVYHPRKQAKSELPTPPTSSQVHPLGSSQALLNSESDPSVRESWVDATTDVVGSQGFDEDAYESLQLYGTVNTRVVGVRYYAGRATTGEVVAVRREPANPYDGNAIRIDNVMGVQIGHIGRNMAAKLAPFLDSKKLVAEGVLTGPKDFYDAPIGLKFYGTSEPQEAAALKEEMKEARLPVSELIQAEREQKRREKEEEKRKQQARSRALKQAAKTASVVGKRGPSKEAGSSSGNFTALPGDDENGHQPEISMDDIMQSTVKFNARELGEVVDKYGAGEEVLKTLPYAKQPTDMKTNLLPYQLQGLAWMLDRENPQLPTPGSNGTTQLWKRNEKDGSFTNIATNFTTKTPTLAKGGLLCDDMGLGKTIQVLSLLVADPNRTKQPTLIISPLSVMSNWSHQAQIHMREDKAMKVLIYHGSTRQGQRAENFEHYDLVITTYQTMALEYLPAGSKSQPRPIPRSNGLFSVNWRRVVLDEGHNIRSAKAKMSQAAYALQSTSRWVLTGTPIVNTLKDLQSLIRFLRLTGGLQELAIFTAALTRPINQGDPEASTLLQALVSTLVLRRMKDMKFIDLRLPELSSHRYSVAFAPQEREKYEAFEQEAKGLLVEYQTRRNNKGENTYSHLLEVLLRLRQTCSHWKMCGERATNLVALVEQNKKVKLTSENVNSLQNLLQLSIDSHEECPVCFEPLHSPIITACAHVFGGECIARVIETQHKCPMCRSELESAEDLVHPPAEEDASPPPNFNVDTSSTKIEALLNILKASRKKSPDTKTVVFSQWTSFLNIVQARLAEEGLDYCRLDGTMNVARRDHAMDRLANDSSCVVMLASLSVCSVGLNLVAANQVILADTWWAPAIEDQAVDRVHRLGQQRPVTVFRLVMEDSIEERVISVQTEKRKLMMTAFQEKAMKRGSEKSARLADIEKLLK